MWLLWLVKPAVAAQRWYTATAGTKLVGELLKARLGYKAVVLNILTDEEVYCFVEKYQEDFRNWHDGPVTEDDLIEHVRHILTTYQPVRTRTEDVTAVPLRGLVFIKGDDEDLMKKPEKRRVFHQWIVGSEDVSKQSQTDHNNNKNINRNNTGAESPRHTYLGTRRQGRLLPGQDDQDRRGDRREDRQPLQGEHEHRRLDGQGLESGRVPRPQRSPHP